MILTHALCIIVHVIFLLNTSQVSDDQNFNMDMSDIESLPDDEDVEVISESTGSQSVITTRYGCKDLVFLVIFF